MNRAQRRRLAAEADRTAMLLAASTYDRAPGGRLVPVAHPRARATLARAFAHMLRHGQRPHVTRLAPQDAATFPASPETPPGAAPWLAVGLDVDGRGTFALRVLTTIGARDAAHQRRSVEALMLGELDGALRERWAMPGLAAERAGADPCPPQEGTE